MSAPTPLDCRQIEALLDALVTNGTLANPEGERVDGARVLFAFAIAPQPDGEALSMQKSRKA